MKFFHLYLEIGCLFFALLFLKDLKKHRGFIYFFPFLLVTVTVELVAKFVMGENTNSRPARFLMFNIFTTAEFVFYSAIFLLHLNNTTLKKIIRILIPVYLVLVTVNIIFIQGPNSFHTYTFLLGSFFMVVYSCFYLYESILPESLNSNLSKQPFFWVCIGLLIFYLGSVIINALFEYLTSASLMAQGTVIYTTITNSLNVILYGSFSIAFILCRNNRKTSSSPS